MKKLSYPEFEPAWVESAETAGRWSLRWLARGKPGPEIGVLRELDVPGMSTIAASDKIRSIPLAKQLARMWAPVSKST